MALIRQGKIAGVMAAKLRTMLSTHANTTSPTSGVASAAQPALPREFWVVRRVADAVWSNEGCRFSRTALRQVHAQVASTMQLGPLPGSYRTLRSSRTGSCSAG